MELKALTFKHLKDLTNDENLSWLFEKETQVDFPEETLSKIVDLIMYEFGIDRSREDAVTLFVKLSYLLNREK